METFKFDENGNITLIHNLKPMDVLPVLPRMGICFQLDRSFKQVRWYGRGPFETYPDRKSGAKIGIYISSIEEQYVPYIVPQDCGNRTDVRWLEVLGEEIGIRIEGEKLLNMGVLPYSARQLADASHYYELVPDGSVYLNIDYRTAGVGNGSLRAETLQEYRVYPEEVTEEIHISLLGRKIY